MHNLLDYDSNLLAEWLAANGEAAFRVPQILKWVHQHGVAEFDVMSNIGRSLRARLSSEFEVRQLPVVADSLSGDGTRKFLFDVGSGNAIESVFIPEPERGTLCVSTQAGCALACAFCATGRQGFSRNLTVGEIVGQLWQVTQAVRSSVNRDRAVTNVVFMGMGEPLANIDNVIKASRLMLDDNAYGLSRRRITVSTAGVVPGIEKLALECPVSLAVSLHAPNDALRDQLVPINKKYPLRQLLASCRSYLDHAPRDFITFEYVMIAGVNDSLEHARELVSCLSGISCKVNLIPFNPVPGIPYSQSTPEAITSFVQYLWAAGVVTTVRKQRGDDVSAACGQLAGRVQDRTKRIFRMSEAIGYRVASGVLET